MDRPLIAWHAFGMVVDKSRAGDIAVNVDGFRGGPATFFFITRSRQVGRIPFQFRIFRMKALQQTVIIEKMETNTLFDKSIGYNSGQKLCDTNDSSSCDIFLRSVAQKTFWL